MGEDVEIGVRKPPAHEGSMSTPATKMLSQERRLPPTRTGKRVTPAGQDGGGARENRSASSAVKGPQSGDIRKLKEQRKDTPPQHGGGISEISGEDGKGGKGEVDILRVETPPTEGITTGQLATNLDGKIPPRSAGEPSKQSGGGEGDDEEEITPRRRAVTTAGEMGEGGESPRPGSKSLHTLRALSRARSNSFRMSFSRAGTPSGEGTPPGEIAQALKDMALEGQRQGEMPGTPSRSAHFADDVEEIQASKGGSGSGEHDGHAGDGGGVSKDRSRAKSHQELEEDAKLKSMSRSARRMIEKEERGGERISTIASTDRAYSPLVYDSPISARRYKAGVSEELSSLLSPRETNYLAAAKENPRKSRPGYRHEIRTLVKEKHYAGAANASLEALDHCPEDKRLSKAFEETLTYVAANRPYWFPEGRKKEIKFTAQRRKEPSPEPEEIELLGEEWEFLLMRIEDILQQHQDPDKERRLMREALRPNISVFERLFHFYRKEAPVEIMEFPDVENSDPMSTESDFETDNEDDTAIILEMIEKPRDTMSQLQLWLAVRDAKIPKRDMSITDVDNHAILMSKWKPFELPGSHNPRNRLHMFEMAEAFVRIAWLREVHVETVTKRFEAFISEYLNPLDLKLPKANPSSDAFIRLVYRNIDTFLRPYLKQLMRFFRFVVEKEPVQDRMSIYELERVVNFNDILSLFNSLELMDPRLNVRKTMKVFELTTNDEEIVPQTHANNIDSRMNFLEFVELLARSAMVKAAKNFKGKVAEGDFHQVFSDFMKTEFLVGASRQYPGRL
mmetsp:Transcript_8751/g.23625  ORF Transcript_8751/g.23625 Transcript_8751/m.23625 type:complete len:792 (-) Transcript_8751:133-2508(-)